MATDGASSVQGLVLRASRLNPDGTVMEGPCNSYITSAFMSVSIEPEYLDGEEIEEPGADGSLCVYFQARNQLKRVNIELAICNPDPVLYSMLGGGEILYGTGTGGPFTISDVARANDIATVTVTADPASVTVGDTIVVDAVTDATFDTGALGATVVAVDHVGFTVSYASVGADKAETADTGTVSEIPGVLGWQSPAAAACGYEPANPDGISLEIWTRAIVCGAPAAINPFWKFVVPRAYLDFTGERVIENGMLANEFSGWGVGNANFGEGPACDWAWDSDRPYSYVRTATAPTGQNGCFEVEACA